MTVSELRRFLNTLPLDSIDWPIAVIDSGTGDLFSVEKAIRDGVDGHDEALILYVTISEE